MTDPSDLSPDLTVLSLGAGVQSTTLALLAEEGALPKPDVAIFSDAGWEPRAVYEHLDRLEAALSYPVVRVSAGSVRDVLLNRGRDNTVSVPLFLRFGDSSDPGMSGRQCTENFKLVPIRRKIRELLGAPAPDYRRVPKGKRCEQWVGFSTDEVARANRRRDSEGLLYLSTRYPLLDLGMSRTDCSRWLRSRGWDVVVKSACIGCPYQGNRRWREMRDTSPADWADAVFIDEAVRRNRPESLPDNAVGAYFHRSLLPLVEAPIDRVTRREWRDRQINIFEAVADQVLEDEMAGEEDDPDGCSPYGCRSGEPVG